MITEAKCLCYNCFQERETPDGPCPYCGFDLAENREKYPVALPAGTVLNGRYIVGRVLGQGGFGITYLALDTQLNARVAIKEFLPGEIATRIGTTVSVMSGDKATDFTYGAERFPATSMKMIPRTSSWTISRASASRATLQTKAERSAWTRP